jgi:hypothetical protein
LEISNLIKMIEIFLLCKYFRTSLIYMKLSWMHLFLMKAA